MLPAVREFLDRVPPRLHRPALEADPELAVRARACGADWRAYLESRGMTVPEALIQLADARADVFVWIACEHHSWELFAPEDARETAGSLAKLAVQFPELAERAQMARCSVRTATFSCWRTTGASIRSPTTTGSTTESWRPTSSRCWSS